MIIRRRKMEYFLLAFCILLLLLQAGTPAAAAAADGSTVSTITFNANEGTVKTASKTVTYNSTYGTLPAPTRNKYEFTGWYTFANGGIRITAGSKVKRKLDHTLYAHWKGKAYTMKLNANGGTLSESTVTVYYGSKYYSLLPTPVRENYNFEGWYTAAKDGEKITENTVYDESTKNTLYAHWTAATITVTFVVLNSGETYSKEVTCGKKYGTLPTPKKTGYTFQGWYKWEDYGEPDAEAVTASTTVSSSDSRNLFALWISN